MIAATRDIMQRRIKPVPVAKATAPVNEIVLRGDEIDLTQFPVPKFWPGDGGRYIGTGDITLTKNPDTGRINVGCYRQMLHGPRRVGPLLFAGQARADRSRSVVGARQAVRGGRRLRHRPGAVHAGGAGVRHQGIELDVAGGLMGRGVELTEAEFVSLPIPPMPSSLLRGSFIRATVKRKARSVNSPAITVVSARRSQ
jgi:4-hydroxy-3-polyprenylbenzoate decarboxylase